MLEYLNYTRIDYNSEKIFEIHFGLQNVYLIKYMIYTFFKKKLYRL